MDLYHTYDNKIRGMEVSKIYIYSEQITLKEAHIKQITLKEAHIEQ